MVLPIAVGLGLIASGFYLFVTARRVDEPIYRKHLISSLAMISTHVVVAVVLASVLSKINSPIVSTVLFLIAGIAVAWSIVRGLRSPSPGRALMILAGSVALSTIFMLALVWLRGDTNVEAALPTPPAAVADAAHDCQCDPAFDIRSLGAGADGSVKVLVGAKVPDDASFLIWTERHPYNPIEVDLRNGVWSLIAPDHLDLDPESVVAFDEPSGLNLRLGTSIGAIAVTSAQGDRAPDSGYINSDTAAGPDERTVRFQAGYSMLNDAQRRYATLLMSQTSRLGVYNYDVGFSAAPQTVKTGSLTVSPDRLEFATGPVDGPDVHLDRYSADGGSSCLGGDAVTCVSLWMNPFLGVDDLLSSRADVEAISVESRKILDRETACVAITEVGSTVLHLGEICAFDDGTIAFADDRSVGAVLLLTEERQASDGGER